MTEQQKMENGQWYDANFDPELLKQRNRTDHLCHLYNTSDPLDTAGRANILRMILGVVRLPEELVVLAPVYFDYGKNVRFNKGDYVNHGCYFMDGAPITVGKMAFIGPNCGFYTATHPLNYTERNQGYEKALPIEIGDNCWIGAGVQVLQGVHIGSGSVIAAGSVVTRDIPSDVLAGGTPAKVIRKINQSGRVLQGR